MATLADCAGCASHEDDVEKGTVEALGAFDMNATTWGADVFVPQNPEASLKNLAEAGGTSAFMARLRSSDKTGIAGTPEDVAARVAQFGENRFPEAPFESWFSIFFDCFKDFILILLIVAAVVSIIIESVENPSKGWIDGVAIMVAVIIVATVTATNDYSKQLQFRKLSKESESLVEIRVLRGGAETTVGVAGVVVGDVVTVDTGAKLPGDGLVIKSNDLRCNEASLTGETDEVHKDAATAPFLLSGTTVTSGTCTYLVTAVGIRSLQGQILRDASAEAEDTPLQVKLDLLATRIGYVGMAVAILTFIAMMIIKATGGATAYTWGAWTVHSFIYGVTIIVVAIPEGLPLAVTISLAYSTQRMLKDKNLIRNLEACETMGNATDICTDKTGTLTENRMTVVEAWAAGSKYVFSSSATGAKAPALTAPRDLPAPLRDLLRDQLSLNSTAGVIRTVEAGGVVREDVKGSKTEGAGLQLVSAMGFAYDALRTAAADTGAVLKQFAFSSERKMMSTIVALPDGRVRVFTTGGSDMVLSRCDRVAALGAGGDVTVRDLTPDAVAGITATVITPMAADSLRTIALAYCDYPSRAAIGEDVLAAPETALTLYAILGIKDPLRAGVPEAVAIANSAGVLVRMVTGDNEITARAIATECGIYVAARNDIVMTGPAFRTLTPALLDMVLPRLTVLARSSPKDKMVLVRRLNGNLPRNREAWEKEHPEASWEADRDRLLPGYYDEWKTARTFVGGEVYKAVVGVTGDGTNDAPALKASDVGLSMGIAGTEVAKEASDIIITDDNFASIVKAILWGRSVYDNVQSFLQFQLTVNVVALLLTFIAAVIQEEPPLNPIMMLWVNLIMDTMGALALATQTPMNSLLLRRPYSSNAFLVNTRMWRHVLIQSAFQLILLLVLLKVAEARFGIDIAFLNASGHHLSGASGAVAEDVVYYKSTFIFNAFVFCQIFNEFNARNLGDRVNIFRSLHREPTFILIILISIGMQAIMVELGADFTKTTGLTGMHWLYSIALAAITFPLGVVMRFVPVCTRPSDFAEYYAAFFNKKMENDLAACAATHPALRKAGAGAGAGEGGINVRAHVAGMPAPAASHRALNLALTMPASPAGSPVAEAPIGNPLSPTNELGMLAGGAPSATTGPGGFASGGGTGIELGAVSVTGPLSSPTAPPTPAVIGEGVPLVH